ncbi:penicillin acylase family protein [Thalassobaculum sp. OXR-137]|uniref:penicillin acylase family protein n=1 Tax=Thalassobaculum sp. OXR-137 TaxID=3100173 RepID=UPI002AC8D3B0|nr:penicillin acylase family protein [Thalassobaculum sp. OXR-137]WPZ33048.1 penicillin acylase family protein [Thalassobaculum sp. OXR-137]
MGSSLIRRLVVGAVLLLIGLNFLGALGLFWLQGSLPETDGEIIGLSALAAPALIERDDAGTVTIRAARPEDASFALGYAHAQDRLWQMELMRRTGAGRLSEIVGEATLSTDKLLRTLGLRRLAHASYERLSERAKAHVDSYVAGVNGYLETRSGPLPPEFLLAGIEPEPWEPADSLVWARLMSLQLAGNWFSEITRARMLKAGLSTDQVDLLYAPFDGNDGRLTAPDLSALDLVTDSRLAAWGESLPDILRPRRASNAWAVNGLRSPTGRPVLAGDPHLGFQSPNLWWLARVESPGYLRVGAFVPGVPFLVIGHNGAVAWTFTTTHSDTQDLFVERLDPADPTRYLTPEGYAPFETRVERFGVDGETVEHTVRSSRHGPVVSDAMDDAAAAAADGTVLALASASLATDDDTSQALFDMGTAIDVGSLVQALRMFDSPQQNVLFADTAGRMGMVSAGRVPLRRSGDGFYPAPGWSGTHDWTGWAPFDALPQVLDPPGEALINANERVVGADPDLFIARSFDAPYRARRIAEMLAGGDRTVAGMAAMQMDTLSLFARDLLPLLVPHLPTSEGKGLEARAAGLLRAWDGTMAAERVEPLIFAAWVRALHTRLFADELGTLLSDYSRARAANLLAILRDEDAFCDDTRTPEVRERCGDVVAGAYEDALTLLARLYGNKIEAWTWGEAHRAWFSHPIWSRIPVIGAALTTRTPTGGGDYTVSRGSFSGPEDDPFRHRHGAGMRVVYDLTDLDNSRFAAALGPSGNILSPMSLSWHAAWARNDGLRLVAQEEPSHELTLSP